MSEPTNITILPGVSVPEAPNLIALLGRSVGPAGIFIELFFHEDSFDEGVARALFGSGWRDLKHAQEAVEVAGALRDEGHIDFEDGWLARVEGLTNIEQEIVRRVADARANELHADKSRWMAERQLAALVWESARLRRRLGLLPLGYGRGGGEQG
ncbi:MAG: hypothetical protein MI920_18815 [Kiloniellales bacterium]|nr:hypothetical protein [Kiloniellales bacterium]